MERELRTAVYQTLGMMTGAEPEPVEASPAEHAPEMYGRLGLRADHEMFELLVGVDATEAMAGRLAESMLGAGVDKASAVDGLKEFLNVVAGRLRVACGERRVEVLMDQPEAHREQPAARGVAAYRLESLYVWNNEYFRLFLEVNELTRDAGAKTADLRSVAAV